MKFICESELMKNQKHATVMAPESDIPFQVLQSTDGQAMLFSIGADNVLYVTREATETSTGWTKLDLSSSLRYHVGAPVNAQMFAVAQNPQTMAFDVALVFTIQNTNASNYLCFSAGNSGNPAEWSSLQYKFLFFDATGITLHSPLTIANLYLMQIPTGDANSFEDCFFVDIWRDSSNSPPILERYYIQLTSTPAWNPRALPTDLSADSVHSCLGKRRFDRVPGIYTLGRHTTGTTKELSFTPQRNYDVPNGPVQVTRLTVPAGASAITSALDGHGLTNLFVSGTDGLYLFTPDNQNEQATPLRIFLPNNGVVNSASSLAASTKGLRTVVWGLNPQSALFYLYCRAGSEAVAAAWSVPVHILSGVEKFAFYVDKTTSHNVLFAHLSDKTLVQLTQDPVTTMWYHRSILLPSSSIDDMVEYNSFSTHIQVNDDNGVPSPNTIVELSVASKASVYINDLYYVLNPSLPIDILTDLTGTVTVIQETKSLAAINMRVSVPRSTTEVADIHPMAKALQTLGTIQSGADLDKVQIPTASGHTQPLVPSSVTADEKKAAASCIAQLVTASTTLPADGSQVSTLASPAQVASVNKTALPAQVTKKMKTRVNEDVSVLSIVDGIHMAAGDLFGWIRSAVVTVESFAIQAEGSVYHFVAIIGAQVYRTVLDSISAVVHGVEFVFNQIEVAFEDLVAWLGFLFPWDDIVRTHKVIKNILKQYAKKAIGSLDTAETAVASLFDGLESKLSSWANITVPDQLPMASITSAASASAPAGSSSPQSNWGMFHMKSNMSSSGTSYSAPSTIPSTFDQVFQDLETLLTNEVDYLTTTVAQVKTQIVDVYTTLTPTQIFQKLLAILSDLILTTAENFINKLLDVLKLVLDGILDILDATVKVPIISSVYKTITGDDLSFLDLACLVSAIPTTLMFQLLQGEAPYPDDALTRSLIAAPDFASITSLLNGDPVRTSSVKLRALSRKNVSINPSVAETSSLSPLDKANAALNGIALLGSAGVSFFAFVKLNPEYFDDILEGDWCIRGCTIAFYLLYIGPDIGLEDATTWNVLMNDAVTTLAFGKTCLDNMPLASRNGWKVFSGCSEILLNTIWIVPDGAGLVYAVENPPVLWSEGLSFASNMLFDISGIMSGVLALTWTPVDGELKGPGYNAFILAQVLNVTYGVVGLGVAIALAREN